MSSKESASKTLIVATVLCVVCSVMVSTAAVYLKPVQTKNKIIDMKSNILVAAGLMQAGGDVEALYSQYIQPVMVDLETGEVSDQDPETFDEAKALKNPDHTYEIPAKEDIAGIKRRTKLAKVFYIKKDGQTEGLVLPVVGKGLWSTMYGFLALEKDLNTVKGFGFYQQAETPGLGGEVDNPKWKAQWVGKKVFDEAGAPAFQVVKGGVKVADTRAQFQVDALSGATITSNGVQYTILYWLGQSGYGPFLAKVSAQLKAAAAPATEVEGTTQENGGQQ